MPTSYVDYDKAAARETLVVVARRVRSRVQGVGQDAVGALRKVQLSVLWWLSVPCVSHACGLCDVCNAGFVTWPSALALAWWIGLNRYDRACS